MITELVPCGNPIVKTMARVKSRSVSVTDFFVPDVRNGQKFCTWCWVKPFKHPRRLYCSDECRESCNLFCYPQTEAGLHFLILSRGARCEVCSYSWKENIEAARAERIAWLENYDRRFKAEWALEIAADLKTGTVTRFLIAKAKFKIEGKRRPEIDHIIPVALGGTTLGFENLQLLCSDCHKSKTKQDMIEIRGSRRRP